ncbi:SDR family oxidoreductase [Novosphingobium sp. G106]|uniref:SDR family NAD(P)-dependent oxidoreductase n=1 Tax=Novosphingobium sp. G106 TaxID=2849500 RepID=UPI001C2DD3A8|nr:SDR family oxidoreductase [Novosphingobium sp. G106]MBV1686448.1 SDR family oxidoreductase [Novosphingobium sp. G106]
MLEHFELNLWEKMMLELFGLDGKRFLFMGGEQAIGEASAQLLASFGSKVAFLDADLERAEASAFARCSQKANAFAFGPNVGRETAVAAAIEAAEQEIGPLDGMLSVVDLTEERRNQDLSPKLHSFFIAARNVAKQMIARGTSGSIVVAAPRDIASEGRATSDFGHARLAELVKSMASEWWEYGIRVNVIVPGNVVSRELAQASPDIEQARTRGLPMRSRDTVEDIAKAAAFFLSDMSPYVTGQILAIDTGQAAAAKPSSNFSAPQIAPFREMTPKSL